MGLVTVLYSCLFFVVLSVVKVFS